MLIDFTVENFRSIKEPVTLSAVASTHKRNTLDDKIAKPFSMQQRKLEILPVLGMFGPNASGKSNVINALDHLLLFVFNSNNESKDNFYYPNSNYIKPFLLNSATAKNPTKLELRVLKAGNIYSYRVVIQQNTVLEEKLEYIPSELERASTRLIFNRIWDSKTENYLVENGKEFGENYREIQSSLDNSKSFLGFLVNNIKNQFLQHLLLWFVTYRVGKNQSGRFLKIIDLDRFMSCFLIDTSNDIYPKLKNNVKTILKKFDVGIEDIEIKKIENDSGIPDYKVEIIHKTTKGRIKWLLDEESLGTRKLFALATQLFWAFEHGGILLVDELGASTHPHINREIIKMFQNEKINKNHAQLIFTSHDSSLLGKGILRRDQTWFTQKQENGSTDLYSLSDYGVRNDLATEKAYLDGRFKAVPFLPSEREFEEIVEVN